VAKHAVRIREIKKLIGEYDDERDVLIVKHGGEYYEIPWSEYRPMHRHRTHGIAGVDFHRIDGHCTSEETD